MANCPPVGSVASLSLLAAALACQLRTCRRRDRVSLPIFCTANVKARVRALCSSPDFSQLLQDGIRREQGKERREQAGKPQTQCGVQDIPYRSSYEHPSYSDSMRPHRITVIAPLPNKARLGDVNSSPMVRLVVINTTKNDTTAPVIQGQ